MYAYVNFYEIQSVQLNVDGCQLQLHVCTCSNDSHSTWAFYQEWNVFCVICALFHWIVWGKFDFDKLYSFQIMYENFYMHNIHVCGGRFY